MCEFCEKGTKILDFDHVDDWMLGWGDATITLENAMYSKRTVFIDRGYLRLADPDDCQCMDHGERVKINYCPFCGEKI